MQTTQRPVFVADVVRRLSRPRALRAQSAVTAFQPHLAGDCGVWHGKEILAKHLPAIIRSLMNHESYVGIMVHPLFHKIGQSNLSS
ncbi:hypothetical protein LBPG_02277 [Lacticaseibacillus paracasei subsp. paracasei 8700:2]|uniref:Uncharacterized protein n=1 Tax=Lacticaseibacillus paracasei subsp. paracasei 8700:2 TaxID=537973 RepID=A0A826HPT8_LACPA|nr:hypothetical protein LBPG_02277 [Lacticaseibacillus paracasei subsp. paracasei 8700:2]